MCLQCHVDHCLCVVLGLLVSVAFVLACWPLRVCVYCFAIAISHVVYAFRALLRVWAHCVYIVWV